MLINFMFLQETKFCMISIIIAMVKKLLACDIIHMLINLNSRQVQKRGLNDLNGG